MQVVIESMKEEKRNPAVLVREKSKMDFSGKDKLSLIYQRSSKPEQADV